MGGDHGVTVTVPAALRALQKHPNLQLILVGNSDKLRQQLHIQKAKESERLVIHHTTQEVAMDELPSQAMRMKKDSSMRVAINLVKEGKAQACVSAGNTGALMATARFVLKTLPGVDRPAIIAAFPTDNPTKEVRLLDLGANIDSSAESLYQFAVMGSALVSAIDNIPRPKVGLLNIGQEEIKGNEQVKLTAQMLSENKDSINYVGFVEGNDIFTGKVDLIVCDGFVGNVALKTMEGAAKLVIHFAREAFTKNWLRKLIAVIATPVLRDLKKDIDPRRRNGASFLGLQGIVIKSHGGADVTSYSYAIEEAVREVENDIPKRIHEKVGKILD